MLYAKINVSFFFFFFLCYRKNRVKASAVCDVKQAKAFMQYACVLVQYGNRNENNKSSKNQK